METNESPTEGMAKIDITTVTTVTDDITSMAEEFAGSLSPVLTQQEGEEKCCETGTSPHLERLLHIRYILRDIKGRLEL